MMPRISRRLLVVGLLVVALLCGLGVLVSLRSAATEKDQIRTRIRSLAASAAATTERYVTGKIDILSTIAGLQPFRQGDVAGMSATLGQIDAESRGFSQAMGWIDRTGHVRVPRAAATVDLGDRSYVRAVLATGRPYVSEAIVGRIRSAAVIVFAVPTRDAAGDVNGVLTGVTRLADLNLLAPSLEVTGADVRLVDRDGNLLIGQPGSARPTPVSPRSPYREMRETRSGLVEGAVGLTGVPDRIIGYATAPTADWLVGLAEPRARAFASADGNRRNELIAIAVVGGLVAAGLLLAARWIAVSQAEEERRRRMRNRLRETAAALLTAVDVESVGSVLAAAARDELDASWAVVLAREAEQTAVIAAAGDPPDEAPTLALPGGDRSSVAVAEHRVGERSEGSDSNTPATLVRIDVGGKGTVLLVGFDRRRELDVIDQRCLSGLADDGALALERAVLTARELAARERADLLARVGSELDMTDGSDARVRRLVRLLVPDFADVAVIGRVSDDPAVIELGAIAYGDPGADERLSSRWEGMRLPRAKPSDAHRLLVDGKPQLLDDATARVTFADLVGADLEDAPLVGPLRSVIRVPLLAGNRIVAGLMLAQGSSERRFDEDDLALATEIAGRASVSIERARLYELEHGIAFQLQQSMLGVRATSFGDQVGVTARYLPAERELQVGGDWHDAFALPDGQVGLVVGDVVGHGLTAAAAMGQLRSALRALAAGEPDPAEVIRRLEAFALDTEGARLATVAYAILDPVTGLLRYCVAGHPPPLLLSPDGAGTFLWDGRSGPLGVAGATERIGASTTLEAGSTVLLYSDGLFERRGELLDVSLGRLRTEAIAHRDGPPDALADGVLAGMLGDARKRDDVALLVASLQHVGRRLFRRIPANPGELARLRHEARDWLTSTGVDPARTEDAVLALGEAAANAVEHAYPDGEDGEIEVELTRDDDAGVCMVVRDFGRWRSPAAPGRRGRGIWIMRRLAQDVSTTTDGGGTTVTIRMTLPVRRGAPS